MVRSSTVTRSSGRCVRGYGMALSSKDAQKSVLRMFGAPALISGKAQEPFAAERPYQLLAYLASRRDWVGRDKLVALLCPDVDQASARRNLRQIAFNSRRVGDRRNRNAPARTRRSGRHADQLVRAIE